MDRVLFARSNHSLRSLVDKNQRLLPLKGLAHADLAKKQTNNNKTIFCMRFYCFICDYYVALISALVLLKCGSLRITVVV